MAKGTDAGSSFLAGVLANLPEADRAKGEELLNQFKALGNGAVVAAIGDGVLAQGDYSSHMDTLRARQLELETEQQRLEEARRATEETYQQQTEWWTKNQNLLKEAQRLKASGHGNGNPNPSEGAPVAGISPEDVQKLLDTKLRETAGAFLQFSADKDEITAAHFKKFGQPPDYSALYAHPKVNELGLKGVYHLVYKEQLDTWEQTAAKQREEEIRRDERQRVQAQMTQMPYPVGSDPTAGSSPLDVLTGAQDQVTDKAVAHYHQILAERHAAGRA